MHFIILFKKPRKAFDCEACNAAKTIAVVRWENGFDIKTSHNNKLQAAYPVLVYRKPWAQRKCNMNFLFT